MPRSSWSNKDERQYEHVKKSELERGRTKERAKEIAARTVNQQRRSEGRAKSGQSRATGNPSTPLEERTKTELLNRARELKIDGRNDMDKAELIEAIRSRE